MLLIFRTTFYHSMKEGFFSPVFFHAGVFRSAQEEICFHKPATQKESLGKNKIGHNHFLLTNYLCNLFLFLLNMLVIAKCMWCSKKTQAALSGPQHPRQPALQHIVREICLKNMFGKTNWDFMSTSKMFFCFLYGFNAVYTKWWTHSFVVNMWYIRTRKNSYVILLI